MMKCAKLAIMPASGLQQLQSLASNAGGIHTVNQQAVFGGCNWFYMGYRWHYHAAWVCYIPVERHDL